jgi:hypothetical protein
MKFVFDLVKDDCYRRFSGECSLEQKSSKSSNLESEASYCGEWSYCRKLHLAVVDGKVDGQKESEDIDITEYACGHHAIRNGQHRICICKRIGLDIYSDFRVDHSSDCPVCRAKKRSFTYRIKAILGLNDHFIY